MKIRSYRTIENGVYNVALTTQDWSEGDRNLMAYYGEPTVDVGGTFTAQYVDYTLPSVLVRIMSEVPIKQGFDSRDYVDAEARALLWEGTVEQRINDAVIALRTQTDTFTNESVINI